MRMLSLLAVALSLTGSLAGASPAATTANVNFREGPGTGFATLATIPADTNVDLQECDDSGAWCVVTYEGISGFVSGDYIKETDPDLPDWPRSYTTDKGATIVVYQPQLTDWKDFSVLEALLAAEYTRVGTTEPVFGVIGLAGDTEDDVDTDEVILTNVRVTELDFSALDREELADLSIELGKAMPTGPITLSEEHLTGSIAEFKRTDDVSGLAADPPPIFASTTPAVLLQTDGKAVEAPVKGVTGLSFVVNTNWDLFKTDVDGSYYLRDEKSWLTAKDLAGEWQAVETLPEIFSGLPDDESWTEAKAAIPPMPFEDGKKPRVFYSDTPAELIVFEGDPALEDVPGTGLQWASNSENDVFFRKEDGLWYILVSGRWFSSSALDGTWTFATSNLPDEFKDIPDDSPYYAVRASIPGTSESAEARLKAVIPQRARVATDGSVTVDVSYSGDPKFEQIEGTSLSYAVNTNEQVIQVGDKFYAVKDGVWFVGNSPTGPFSVATAVPDEIYTIPPSSPVYNVTYVKVYDSEPGAVWFGYTMGYLGAYLAWDTFVYGTGWRYPSYWDYDWHDGYYPYYPRPATYGVGAFYNPARGTYGRYGYAYGPYRGIAGGAAYNPRTGTYFRGGAVAGPAGARGFMAAYNPRTGTGAVVRGGHSVYGSWGSAGVRRGGDWARISGG